MSTENLKANQVENTINQSDIGHYIEKSLDNFSSANTDKGFWKLYNKNNPDPIKLEKFPTWGSMGLFFIFYLLTVYTDMFIGIFVVMLLMGLLWGEKRIWVSFLTATLTPLFIFLLFDFVLKIRFPRGILMDMYYG